MAYRVLYAIFLWLVYFRRESILETVKFVKLIKKLCDDKKADDVLALDVRGLSDIADFFVIATGNSAPQVNAISGNVQKELSVLGINPSHVEGEREASWVVIDYFDVIVHVFYKETRKYYNLERLWGDAPRLG